MLSKLAFMAKVKVIFFFFFFFFFFFINRSQGKLQLVSGCLKALRALFGDTGVSFVSVSGSLNEMSSTIFCES